MSLIKWCLRAVVFIAMFLAWNFAMFLVMIYLSNWFKQWYFLLDINTFLNSTINSPNINFSIFTWLICLYNFIFSIIIAYFYAKNSVSVEPSQFAIGNRETKITIGILILLIFITILGFLLKKSIYSSLIIKSFVNASDIIKLIITIIPVSLFFTWFLDRSFLVIHLLSPSIYKKFGINCFKVNLNNNLSFWAQNIGKRKNKFCFKGICRLNNFLTIKKKKENSEFLIKTPVNNDTSWIELNSQDTMPIQVIKSNWLRNFIGLFSETVCIVYEGADERLYRENVYVDNCDDNIILYSKNKKIIYSNMLFILIQVIAIYLLGKCFSSVFLYTLSFVLILFLGMHFVVRELIRERSINNVSLAVKMADTQPKGLFLQIKNNTSNNINVDFKICCSIYDKKTFLEQNNIFIEQNSISPVMFFSEENIRLTDPKVKGWKIILKSANNKQYLFDLSKDKL